MVCITAGLNLYPYTRYVPRGRDQIAIMRGFHDIFNIEKGSVAFFTLSILSLAVGGIFDGYRIKQILHTRL